MTIYFGDGSNMAAAAGGNSTKLADANGVLTSNNDGSYHEIVVTGLGGYHQVNFSLFVGHIQSNQISGGNAKCEIRIGRSTGVIDDRYRWCESDYSDNGASGDKTHMYFNSASGSFLGNHTGYNCKCSIVQMQMFNWNNTSDIVFGVGHNTWTNGSDMRTKTRCVSFQNPITNHAMDRMAFRFPDPGSIDTRYHYVIEGVSS